MLGSRKQTRIRVKRGRSRVSLFFLGLSCAACHAWVPQDTSSISVGLSNNGFLIAGQALASRGDGFVRARPGEGTGYGTSELVQALSHATRSVAQTFPGTMPLRIGDLSAAHGGLHSRHGSHRSGRDVDVLFYVTSLAGEPRSGHGWLAFDETGVAHPAQGAPGPKEDYRFDDARNWHFVRDLLANPTIHVQWIFCGQGIKDRLIAYAESHESDTDVRMRARWVLHQPSYGNPHRDHFHIRIACPREDLTQGCQDGAPLWPWIRQARLRELELAQHLSDAVVAARLLD